MANVVGRSKCGGKEDGEEEIDRFRERIREAAGLFFILNTKKN